MVNYTVVFAQGAENDLARLDRAIAQRIFKKIRWLSENYDQISPETLTGQWTGVYKLRIGNYRVLYTSDVEQERLTIHVVGHRRDVYK